MAGKVKHVVYDPKNPQHVKDLEELRRLSGENLTSGTNFLLQYVNGKVVGFAGFTPEKSELDVNFMYILPEYRDTHRKEFSEEEKIKANKVIFEMIGEKYPDRAPSKYPGRDKQRFRSANRMVMGFAKRNQQLFLAAKMLRYLAQRHGVPVYTVPISDAGRKVTEKYMMPYFREYFQNRGKQKPRKSKFK